MIHQNNFWWIFETLTNWSIDNYVIRNIKKNIIKINNNNNNNRDNFNVVVSLKWQYTHALN